MRKEVPAGVFSRSLLFRNNLSRFLSDKEEKKNNHRRVLFFDKISREFQTTVNGQVVYKFGESKEDAQIED